MLNMVRADLYRIVRGKGIYIAMLLVVIVTSASVARKEAGYIGNASISVESEESGEKVVETGNEQIESISVQNSEEKKLLIRNILATNINLYYPLIILVFVILVSDFSNHTIKNTLTSVSGKRWYYLTKLVLILVGALVFILAGNFFAWLLNMAVNGRDYTEPLRVVFQVTVRQLPIQLGAVSLLALLSIAVKRAAIFNAVAITFVMVFQIVVQTTAMLTKSELLMRFLSKYELQSALRRLAFFPDTGYVLTCAAIGAGEVLIAVALGCIVLAKSEIA